MNTLTTLLDRLTGRTPLKRRIAALSARSDLALEVADIERQRADNTAAMLGTSRNLHARALQRVDELEVALEHAHELLRRERGVRRQWRSEMRMWIDRETKTIVSMN